MPTTWPSFRTLSTCRAQCWSVIPPAVVKSPGYIGRHGTKRLKKAVLIGAVPPLMLQTPANPAGLPISAFHQIRTGVVSNRAQFYKDLALPFFGYNKPDAQVSEGVVDWFWLQGMLGSVVGACPRSW